MLAAIALLSIDLAGATPIAIYPVRSKDVPIDTTIAADASLRGEVGDLRSYQLFNAGQTQSVIAQPGTLGLDCDDGKIDCLASVGRLLGAAVVVYGVASPNGADLLLVDARTAEEVRRVHLDGPPVAAMREAGIALLAPDQYTGTLEVVGQHGKLAVDNAERGDLPQQPIALPVGKHQVTVTLPGQASWNSTVEIRWRQSARLDAERAPSGPAAVPIIEYTPLPATVPESVPPPHPSRPMSLGRQLAYYGFTAAIVGGAVGIVLGATAEDNVQSLQSMTRPIPVSQAGIAAQAAARSRDFGVAADVTWGVAAVLGVASIVLYCVSPEHAPEKPFSLEAQGNNAVIHF